MLRRLLDRLRRRQPSSALEPSDACCGYVTSAFAAKAAIQAARGKFRLDQAASVLRMAAVRAELLNGQDWVHASHFTDQQGEPCPTLSDLYALFNARFRAHHRRLVA